MNEPPLYTTQGGGVCRYDGQRFYWTEPPTEFPEMQVGDSIPEEWGTVAINDAGIREMEDELDLY